MNKTIETVFDFKDPNELMEAILQGWGFQHCQPGKWLEVHACYSDNAVGIVGHTSAGDAIQNWCNCLTPFQQSLLRVHDQGILIVRDWGCDVHPHV